MKIPNKTFKWSWIAYFRDLYELLKAVTPFTFNKIKAFLSVYVFCSVKKPLHHIRSLSSYKQGH